MPRSLRWRLQFWYGILLLLVILGFGLTLYSQVRRTLLLQIDRELEAGARILEGELRSMVRPKRRPPIDRGLPPQNPPGRQRVAGWAQMPNDQSDSPPPAYRRANRGRGQEDLVPILSPPRGFEPTGLQLPRSLDSAYVFIWSYRGEVDWSRTPYTVPTPEIPIPKPEQVETRNRGKYREAYLLGPGRHTILVGRSIEEEMQTLQSFTGQLLSVGIGVFCAGLLGGWWVSSRAVRPINEMSQTAAGITASSLSARINLKNVDFEFERLGRILNAMLARLEASFVQQVRFTADASHELRTPLSVILTHTELALNRPRTTEAYRETIEITQRAADRMKHLVEDLLILARADAGRLNIECSRVDLASLVREHVLMLQPIAKKKNVGVGISGKPVELWGDAGKIGQVVSNLLTNAIQYNRAEGVVTLFTGATGNWAVLRVDDNGPGIPKVDCDHLFDRFYRVDRARSRDNGGSGLGLAICKSIVDAHHGTIRCSSVEGVGTTFEVWLPRNRVIQSSTSITSGKIDHNELG